MATVIVIVALAASKDRYGVLIALDPRTILGVYGPLAPREQAAALAGRRPFDPDRADGVGRWPWRSPLLLCWLRHRHPRRWNRWLRHQHGGIASGMYAAATRVAWSAPMVRRTARIGTPCGARTVACTPATWAPSDRPMRRSRPLEPAPQHLECAVPQHLVPRHGAGSAPAGAVSRLPPRLRGRFPQRCGPAQTWLQPRSKKGFSRGRV